jgi:hypothetical protein
MEKILPKGYHYKYYRNSLQYVDQGCSFPAFSKNPTTGPYFSPPPPIQQPLVGQGLLIIEASRSHSDPPISERLFSTSDRPEVEDCTWQHTTLTRDRHPCCRIDSNPQSQPVSGRRPTP